jgi:preprotein translocase subunit SecA
LFDKTPQEGRKAALQKWWREHNQSPLRLAESVKELGGLHIIGSERHEARRIDNQLRGRSGRQGDPGSSRFFLSLDDDLMRIFAKDWVRNFLKASGMKDGVPLESRMVSRSIEKAQRRVEEHHFGTRKRLLEYDEVMNEQRKLVYALRQKTLEWRELRETMLSWVEDVIALAVERECTENPVPQENLLKLIDWARRKFLLELTPTELTGKSPDEIENLLIERFKASYDEMDKDLGEMPTETEKTIRYTDEELNLPPDQRAEMICRKLAEAFGVDVAEVSKDIEKFKAGALPTTLGVVSKQRTLRLAERKRLLDTIDSKWKDHLHTMDTLREGIYLRGFAQKDPKLEYKREGFAAFEEMFTSMKEHATERLLDRQLNLVHAGLKVESVWNEEQAQAIHEDAASLFSPKGQAQAAAGVGAGTAEMEAQSEHGGEKLKPIETIRRTEREPGPNDPCPCGSGKKYKKCHGPQGGYDGTINSRPVREHKGEAKIGG